MNLDPRYDRHVRAFGADAQQRLAELTVAVVGVGGVGSLIAEALTHLGVGRLHLVDPDTVAASNLNRLIGATPLDAAAAVPKVSLAARVARATNPDMLVHEAPSTVLDPSVWRLLRSADVLVCAVDGHAPRWALNRLAVQYARCYLDVGVDLRPAPDGGALEAGGHLAVVRPNGPCLLCLSGYDPSIAARELDPGLEQAKRAAGHRADGPDEPTPSVIFLNQVLAGHAVAELLNWVAPWRTPVQYALVDLSQCTTTTLAAERDPDCPGSSRSLADAAGLPVLLPTTTPTTLP